ncbi:hypothetical protein LI291_05875 [Intestinibacillus massiliensis]|nr:hypothetical protein [Intestinibacillus massiliensis]
MRPFYKKPWFWGIVGAACIAAVALALALAFSIANAASSGIGDKFDDEAWIASHSSHTAIGIATQEREQDGVYTAKVTARTFSGVQTLWEGKGGSLAISAQADAGEGRFKLVLVGDDGSCLDLSGHTDWSVSIPGRGEIKMVGDTAKDVSVSLQVSRK